jgi:hypothetical protein
MSIKIRMVRQVAEGLSKAVGDFWRLGISKGNCKILREFIPLSEETKASIAVVKVAKIICNITV